MEIVLMSNINVIEKVHVEVRHQYRANNDLRINYVNLNDKILQNFGI